MVQNDIAFEDLRVHYNTGRSYTISGSGRNRVMGYRTGMWCNLGDIELSEWKTMARELIAREGEQELFQQLYSFLMECNHAKSTKTELEIKVLELHISRIFDNQLWVGFVPFNRRFRPETLHTVKLVSVMPECCQKAGFITDARYRKGSPSRDENFCPHCGKWTKISLQENQSPKGE